MKKRSGSRKARSKRAGGDRADSVSKRKVQAGTGARRPAPGAVGLKPAAPHMVAVPAQRQLYVPGRLIVRFEAGALAAAAGVLASTRSVRAAAGELPEEVQGPINYLRKTAGLSSVEPLFVDEPKPRQWDASSVEAAIRPMVRSITRPRRESLKGLTAVTVGEKKATDAVIAKLKSSRAVSLVERVPNRWLAQAGAVDPQRNLQWGLRAIRWFQARRPSPAPVEVAVLDTGIDRKHPELKSVIASYIHRGNSARDFVGHGTHVSGIIAALANNGVGISGVAECKLRMYKVFDDPVAGGDETPFNDLAYNRALGEILDSDVKVVNLSLGGTASSETERLIFESLAEAGKLVVAAMGNEYLEGNPVEYPAAYPSVLSVGAINEALVRASFSNTGRHIGLVAPGDNILSTVPRVAYPPINLDSNYVSWPGTSMATPHVAGCAALVYARNPGLGAAEVRDKLFSTATKLRAMRRKRFTAVYGHGLVNLERALT